MKVLSRFWFRRGGFEVTVISFALVVMSSIVGQAKASDSGVRSERAATGTASPVAGPTSSLKRVFDLRSLRGGGRDVANAALACHDFDWSLLRPALNTDNPRKRITVSVTDASEWGAVGLAWPAPVGKIEVDDDVLDAVWFRDVVLHEVGHLVDFYYLEPEGLRDEIAEILGAPWDESGHSFNAAFTQAFSCYSAVDSVRPLDEAQILALRAVMGSPGPIPTKVGDAALVDIRELEADFTVAQPSKHQVTSGSAPVGPVV